MIDVDINLNEALFKRIEEQSKQEVLEDVGAEILSRVQDKIPVRTGNLLNNTGFNVNEGNVEFYSNTDYAEQVDEKVHFMEEVEFADYDAMIAERVKEVVEQ